MKTFLLSLYTIVLTFSAQATIWRVNNTAGVDADFTTAQQAHDDENVMPGDTLLFEGSPDSYGNLTLIKRLVLIGPGYFLGENPGNQALLSSAKLGTVDFTREVGRDSTLTDPAVVAISSEGSEIMSMETGIITLRVPSVTIRRCKTGSINSKDDAGSRVSISPISGEEFNANANNAVIIQNYLPASPINIVYHDNVIVSNNIFWYISNNEFSTNITCYNNIITYSTGAINLHNATIRNNILIDGNGTVVANNSILSNNLAVNASALPEGNDNQNGVPVSNFFITGGSIDDYTLLNGSPAQGAGFGGVDAGVLGGVTPYIKSGIPPIPTIYEFTAPAVGTTTDGLEIQVKIKSNN